VRTVCATCAAHYPEGQVPGVCLICADERQYLPPGGQRWVSRSEPRALSVQELEPGLHRLTVAPQVGIGQQGYVLSTPDGAVLWDAPGWLDADAVAQVAALGRVRAVACSHPHFYGAMGDWAEALDAPVLVAQQDLAWVTAPTPRLLPWSGTSQVLPGVTLVRCGGHFPGSAVLHRDGLLLTGDTVMVVPSAGWVSFMYSYPNYLPLSVAEVDALVAALEPLAYDRLYGGFGEVREDAKGAVRRSAARYRARLGSPA